MREYLRERYKKLQGLLYKGMTEQGGLLNNIPQGAVLGSAIYGQGIKGKDPFESLLPAFAQTAQIQKLLTPKTGVLKQAYDPNKVNEDGTKGGVVYASDKEIRAKGLTPALTQKNKTTMPGCGPIITEK